MAEKLESAGKVQDYDLEEFLDPYVKDTISKHEAADIKQHKENIERWQNERQRDVEEQVQEIKKKLKIQALGEKLRDIQVKETKLRFFEDQDQITRGIRNAPNITIKKIKRRNLAKYGGKIKWK